MGSGSSKGYLGETSSSGGSGRKGKSKGSRVFQSSCLGTSSSGSRDIADDNNNSDHVNVCGHGSKGNRGNASATNRTEIESDQVKIECYGKVKVEQSDGIPCISSSNDDLNEWNQASIRNTGSRTGSSSSRAASAQSLPSPSRFLSRLSFIPGNVSFRLSRATSLGSSRAYSVPSSSLRVFDGDEEIGIRPRSSNGISNRSGTQQSNDLFTTSMSNRIPARYPEDPFDGLQFRVQSSDFLDNMQDRTMSSHHAATDGGNTTVGIDGNLRSPRIFGELDGIETSASDRRGGVREPVERNVRFSRTLSVGRLRDRVLRRSSASELTFCPLQQEREVRDSGQSSRRQASGGERRVSESEGDLLTSSTSSSDYPSLLFSIRDHEVETSRSREARYHDLLEHRSNFLERRRRIRSQVRALQRLGSRFENLSGHERSCILSGQHRTGRCTCRVNNRDANVNDETSARASISRIVMLAEALFEVLDEIHQQSVVLSSRPSVSSLGSVPAPNEVVESLPVRLYTKSQKHQYEEAAQCYICLLEYEEGDSMRVLPCHHEFHRSCVDKWLKEIHRVCPLCRGDICRSCDSMPPEN